MITERGLTVQLLGTLPYADALTLQEDLVRARRAGDVPDQLLLLEHPHVITLGTSSHGENVLVDDNQRALLGIELFETGRGGDVTYHGPGQLVGYPILDLKPDRCDLHRYVRDLEQMLINALGEFGIAAARKTGLTGVWVAEEKIAAIGVRVSSGWITSHGFALNVNTDLAFFDSIIPCGIRNHGVTSMSRVACSEIEMHAVENAVMKHMSRIFAHSSVCVESRIRAERLDPLTSHT